jgi:uncharacterized membrane protein
MKVTIIQEEFLVALTIQNFNEVVRMDILETAALALIIFILVVLISAYKHGVVINVNVRNMNSKKEKEESDELYTPPTPAPPPPLTEKEQQEIDKYMEENGKVLRDLAKSIQRFMYMPGAKEDQTGKDDE